jgi:hypothetical protein
LDKKSDGKWHQILVTDPLQLSGQSTREFCDGIFEKSRSRWVLVRDLDGAYAGLRGAEGTSIPVSEFLNRVSYAVQYDWGFFFLYQREPGMSIIGKNARANISGADVAIRFVDDQYFYLYTRDNSIYNYLIERYPDSERRIASLENLDIPS